MRLPAICLLALLPLAAAQAADLKQIPTPLQASVLPGKVHPILGGVAITGRGDTHPLPLPKSPPARLWHTPLLR